MPNLIRNKEENAVALVFAERLMDGDPEADSEQGKFLRFLATAIQEYETKIYG